MGDPQGPQVALRAAPRHQVFRRRPCRAPPNCRPATSTTATCPTRPSTSSTKPVPPSASCPSPAKKAHRQDRHRGNRRQDRPHPAAQRLRTTTAPPSRTLDRDLKNVVFGQDAAIDALAKAIKMSAPASAIRRSRSAPSCSAAPPVSARPRSPASSPTRWASSWCASTCPNTWSATRCRG